MIWFLFLFIYYVSSLFTFYVCYFLWYVEFITWYFCFLLFAFWSCFLSLLEFFCCFLAHVNSSSCCVLCSSSFQQQKFQYTDFVMFLYAWQVVVPFRLGKFGLNILCVFFVFSRKWAVCDHFVLYHCVNFGHFAGWWEWNIEHVCSLQGPNVLVPFFFNNKVFFGLFDLFFIKDW